MERNKGWTNTKIQFAKSVGSGQAVEYKPTQLNNLLVVPFKRLTLQWITIQNTILTYLISLVKKYHHQGTDIS